MPVTFKCFLRNLLDASILEYEDLGDPNQLRIALGEQIKSNPEPLLALRSYPGIEDVQEYINFLYEQRRGEGSDKTPTELPTFDPLANFNDMTNALRQTEVSNARDDSARAAILDDLNVILDRRDRHEFANSIQSIISQQLQTFFSTLPSATVNNSD